MLFGVEGTVVLRVRQYREFRGHEGTLRGAAPKTGCGARRFTSVLIYEIVKLVKSSKQIRPVYH